MIRFSSFRKTAALLFALPALACASPSRSPARSVLSDKLREKLELQWVRYDAAQAELIRQSPAPIPRDRWEALLRLPDWMALTADELAELRRDQAERAAAARERARQQSVIDLDAVRASNSAGAFCASFPKGGMLHIHPSGTLKRPTVERLLQQENPRIDSASLIATNRLRLYPDEINYLQGITGNPAFSTLAAPDQARFTGFFFLPPGAHPFTRFDAAFAFIGLVLQSDDAYTSALEDFAKRAASQGVIYVEMTTGIQPADVPAFEEIARRIESRTGVVLRFNRSFNRTRKSQDLIQQAQALLSVRSPVITGIDLLGDETSTPTLESGQGPYGVVLKAVREAGSPLHRTMHAGELGDPRDPRDALVLGAERLGHGVKLAEDPVALEYAVRHHEIGRASCRERV